MNKQRLQDYIQLIQELLTCPSGDEWVLLRKHESLVTPELLPIMEQVANQLVHQGNLKEAKFLHNLAGQIHHLFAAQAAPTSSDTDPSHAYLSLIEALLQCPKGTEEELFQTHSDLIGPGLVQQMQQVAARAAASGNDEVAHYLQHWADNLSMLWLKQHQFKPPFKQVPQAQYADHSTAPQAVPSPLNSPDEPSPWASDAENQAAKASNESHHVYLPQLTLEPIPEPRPVSLPNPSPVLAEAPYEPVSHQLENIARALAHLSEVLAAPPPPSPPPDPLWYMETLERAYAGNWVLTSDEIQRLIGVRPSCAKGQDSFQRGCWLFVKAGKLGSQTAWRVKKELG